jgi:hypothetical protein
MKDLNEFATNLGSLPIEYLMVFVSLAAIGLAAFAIYAIHSIAKDKRRR